MSAVLRMKSPDTLCRIVKATGLMGEGPDLLKRLILVHPRGTVIGYDPEAYARLAGGK